ncbi:F0F1 ATP synthase subunit B [Vagococcus elongatus]|uniref:ATP synthase subunit b n=1 Tax=Vagococcus elongatus TaxID=180344 RepID=A0A430AX51_9ENTE|nr:F0F1 ATP synthase subunit B [Vagococcus elongatus]RSU12623.1 ATP synthase F0 subunit B [Vagococcus elongatus]
MTDYFLIGSTPNTTLTSMAFVSLSFVLLLLLIKKFAWQPMTKMLDKRAETIANNIDDAERSKITAAQLVAENEAILKQSRAEAAEIVRKAKEVAEKDANVIIQDAHADAKRHLEQGKKELEIEKAKLIDSAKHEVADLSIEIAEKIIKKELDLATHQELINSYIEGLGSQNED